MPMSAVSMTKEMRQKTAIIVGAGVGGAATAARLAKAGFKVTVVEKNEFSGGRCSLIHHDGYRFDRGPSLLLLPNLFREAFKDLDTTLEAEGVKLLRCEPNYNVWYSDGECFELSSDLARMKDEVSKWEGRDGYERYLGFLQESHRHYEASIEEVLHKNFTSFFSMLRLSFVRYALVLHPFESIYKRASIYFWTERLRQAFTFASMYMGMSPFDAPATYSLLQYTELAEGIWYPEGGFHKVVEALLKIGKRLGVTYRFSTPVSSIKLSKDGKTATGVTLESGETINADIVINNADLVYAYNNLLPKTAYGTSLSKRKNSCSSISFYWALDAVLPELKTHNIFLAENYRSSFDSIFKDHLLPAEPSFYVNVPSRVDPTAAPPGKDTVVVLCPVGHLWEETPNQTTTEDGSAKLHPHQDWDKLVDQARKSVVSTVRARLGIDLSAHIVHEQVNTPKTWRDSLNLDRGGILGISHSFLNVLSFRPSTKHAHIANLYFVGASTHPGTGVPIVLAGSRITSEQILDDLRMKVPWGEALTVQQQEGTEKIQKGENGLNLVKGPPLFSITDPARFIVTCLGLLALAIALSWGFRGVGLLGIQV